MRLGESIPLAGIRLGFSRYCDSTGENDRLQLRYYGRRTKGGTAGARPCQFRLADHDIRREKMAYKDEVDRGRGRHLNPRTTMLVLD